VPLLPQSVFGGCVMLRHRDVAPGIRGRAIVAGAEEAQHRPARRRAAAAGSKPPSLLTVHALSGRVGCREGLATRLPTPEPGGR
jgi:hypothetical protein